MLKESESDIFSPGNYLRSMRGIISETMELILNYRSTVPTIPELCLPTACSERAIVPVVIQAAMNVREYGKSEFWPSAEIPVVRENNYKGHIDVGLFSTNNISLMECKAVRTLASTKSNHKIDLALKDAEQQLKGIDVKSLLRRTPEATLKNIRADNKLIAMVAVNVLSDAKKDTLVNKQDELFHTKFIDLKAHFKNHLLAAVRYKNHFINQKNDQFLKSDEERTRISIGHIFILKEVFA